VSYGGKVVVVWVVGCGWGGLSCEEMVCWILCTIAVLVQDVAEAAEGGGCVGCVKGVLPLCRERVLDLVYQRRLLSRMLRRFRYLDQRQIIS